jgi:hypothetical protein
VRIANTTIDGNRAGFQGGGLDAGGGAEVELGHATITRNTASQGANLFVAGGAVEAFASVIALGRGGNDCASFAATMSSRGYNATGDGSCSLDAASDLSAAGDLRLGALDWNGGPTLTRAPLPLSPLKNRVPESLCARGADQRGVMRPQGSACDIGAVELVCVRCR